MRYGLIVVSVFAIIILSASLLLLNPLNAFRPSNNPGTSTPPPPPNPNINSMPTDNTPPPPPPPNPNINSMPTDNTPPPNPNNNQITVLGSSPYTDNAGRFNIIGEVRNNSFKTLNSVRATAFLYDSSNRLINTGSAYTSLEELKPQQTSNFHIVFSNQAPIDPSSTYTLSVSSSEERTPKPPRLQVNFGNAMADSPDTFRFLGQVTNQGNQPANFVKVSGSFYDANNQLVDVETVSANPQILQPGESGSFEFVVSKSSNPLLAQIDSASFDVQSAESSSTTMGEKIVVGPTLNSAIAGASPAPVTPTPGGILQYRPDLLCGENTHYNFKKGVCVRDKEENHKGSNSST